MKQLAYIVKAKDCYYNKVLMGIKYNITGHVNRQLLTQVSIYVALF